MRLKKQSWHRDYRSRHVIHFGIIFHICTRGLNFSGEKRKNGGKGDFHSKIITGRTLRKKLKNFNFSAKFGPSDPLFVLNICSVSFALTSSRGMTSTFTDEFRIYLKTFEQLHR